MGVDSEPGFDEREQIVADKADAVVIGAGVIGSAITFELARRGRSVICVDAGDGVGAGSTSASSAIIRFHYSTHDSVLTAWESAAMWLDLSNHLGIEDQAGMARFVQTGCLVFDFPGTNRPEVLGHFDAVGVPYEELGAGEIKERYPALDVGDYFPPRSVDDPEFGADPVGEVGGYFTPDAGFIDDPMLAAGNFMNAARHNGAALRLRSEVVAIRQQGGAVSGVDLASGESIECPIVINVGGPDSGSINAMAGVTGDMRINHRPLRQEVFVAQDAAGFGMGEGTIVTDLNLGTYFRPHPGGTLLIGGTEPDCDPLEWVDDTADFNVHPTVMGFERSVYRAARRLPAMGIPSRPVGLAALYDASDDWVPLYDKSNLAGFYMACGTSGNQFKNAPMAGIFLAELIEAAERGQDHDTEPVQVRGARTGQTIDLAAFSRLRQLSLTSGTVLG